MSNEVIIIDYRDDHHEAFRVLNLAWLDHYSLTEAPDLEVLDDPRGMILDKGGFIWIAESEGAVVGSAALIRGEGNTYELAKMAVADEWRGKGISKLLIEKCLAKAKELGAMQLILFSNHQLQTAIRLYEKYGFKHVPFHGAPFETADVRMELVL